MVLSSVKRGLLTLLSWFLVVFLLLFFVCLYFVVVCVCLCVFSFLFSLFFQLHILINFYTAHFDKLISMVDVGSIEGKRIHIIQLMSPYVK